ncbi:GNAT family N-acetyltransferase [Rufibacter immobilis]|uniref:GNAT family N-acetyltransferase n=1 Tax=Rufibacter immobilis TaxID=1348778 RepID=UPI0035ED0309
MSVTVKKIENQQEMEAALRIRENVFVQEQHVPADAEYDQYENTATHYLVTKDGIPCGTARWRQTEKGIKLERFAVLASYRNQQIGSVLLKKIMEDIQEALAPGQQVYMHAQLHAVPFYARHNFSTVGDLFTECDIEHYQMVLNG